MKSTALRFAVACALVAATAFSVGVAVGGGGEGARNIVARLPLVGDGLNATSDTSVDLTDFWKAYNALEANFVETHASSTLPSTADKLWGSIKGLADSYGDPYTVFLPPKEAKQFSENISGNFSGVGMEIDIKNGVLTVIAPLKGTPAEEAGIEALDQIVAIDGKPTDGLALDELISRIRGPAGTVVAFTIVRGEKRFDLSVVRRNIQVPEEADTFGAATGVYTIALYEFTGNSADLFDAAFERFKRSGSQRLLIDLRGDPGGYLDAAVAIAGHFLPKGTLVVSEDHEGKAPADRHTSPGPDDLPAGTAVAVLIDQGSASASEILAGALQDHHAATLIGAKSFGKGSVQELIDIDHGALKVTVARWLTPSGRSISDGGLTPDLAVARTDADAAAKKDPQLARAVEFLTTGK